MFLEFADWLIYADTDATRTYSAEEAAAHCTCGYCLNFYQAVDKAYPNLRYFLSRFGVDIEAPESLIPITPELYQASYVVQGKILRNGSEPIWVHDIAVTLEEDSEPDWFILNLGLMNIPWVLSQHPDTVPKPYGLSDMLADLKQDTKAPQQF